MIGSTFLPPFATKFLRRVLFTLSITCLLIPFSFEVKNDGSIFFLWRDQTGFALLSMALGIVAGIGWLSLRKMAKGPEPVQLFRPKRKLYRRDSPYNIFGPMELRLRVRLAVAVFLTFCIIGPMSILMNPLLSPVPLSTFVILTISSGAMSASFVMFGHRKILLILSFSVCLAINASVADISRIVFNAPTVAVSPELSRLADTPVMQSVNAQRIYFGVTGILLLGAGYAVWIVVITMEGANRRKYQTEIEVAQRIQQQLLPSETFMNGWLEGAGVTLPATDVGGDYFDFVRIDDHRTACIIADVAGHGIGAGILSAMVKSALRSQLLHDVTPVAVLENLNATIHHVADRKMFATCAYVLFDESHHTARIATAGHPPLLLRRANGNVEEIRTMSLALGMRDTGSYSDVSIALAPGDALVLYTDGVTEATNPRGEQFDMSGLRQTVAGLDAATAKESSLTILQSIRAFRKAKDFIDDATVVCARILPPSQS